MNLNRYDRHNEVCLVHLDVPGTSHPHDLFSMLTTLLPSFHLKPFLTGMNALCLLATCALSAAMRACGCIFCNGIPLCRFSEYVVGHTL
jgi:hypothetical protein